MTEKEFTSISSKSNGPLIYGEIFQKDFSILMRKVYTWMTLALLITGITAYGIASSSTLSLVMPKIIWGLAFAELALVFTLSSTIQRLSLTTATLMFIVYSIMNGAMLSSIFLVYEPMLISKVFFITAGTFGAMSVYGYTTKKDLASIGKILIMALLGLIIATIVNLFMKSPGLDYLLSYIGAGIFIGLVAWDTQKIKKMLMEESQYGPDEHGQKLALLGALSLYLDFINLFLHMLRIFGNKK